jgi:Fe-S-cluster containining protein
MMKAMLEPEKLKDAFHKVEEENWQFRSFLKGRNEAEIDQLIHKLNRELFRQIDCIACSNCCKLTGTALNKKDIAQISGRLSMSAADFIKQYLRNDDDGEMVIKLIPCPFLTAKGCSIYDIRPELCREYPYTSKADMISRLINLVNNCVICPVIFETFERLKEIYRDEFKKYQKEMAGFWG